MISFDEAIEIIGSATRPLGTETVALDRAAGRVLAAPVIAAIDSPRADVSAMDGYAVRGDDLAAYPVRLAVIGESLPGLGWPGTIGPSDCVRIFTGAPLPAGADRIVIQEHVRREGNIAIIDADPGPATWIRRRAGDFGVGDPVIPPGHRLDPAALVAAAGADAAAVQVFRRPRLALLTTGDELVESGHARSSALAVPDSVSLGLASLAGQWGAEVVMRERVADDLDALSTKAREAIHNSDVVLVVGGASVGERDFAKRTFEPLGLELLFSKVSIRPGKPAWFGRAGGNLVLGLPGNPTSALATARLFLAPLLSALQGRRQTDALCWEPAHLRSPISSCDARETFHRAKLAGGEVTLLAFQESHAQKTLAEADVLIRQRAGSGPLEPGAIVQVLRL